ncbi:galectin-4 [Corvus hawaiiensis]|uniref:galectin-4 n=1 Tax=Corvus hawaiiensis TaxID=134902 RepID=UPI0020199238|nr:galectin-4 [Corvus hawaiiensis]
MAVYVQGVVKPQPDRFRINLATGPSEAADVALHLNPRFSGDVAVLNSRRGGCWGDEQRRELHPLCPGGPFEIVISVTPEGYRILVNGTFFDEFPHRLPPEQVAAVTVDGTWSCTRPRSWARARVPHVSRVPKVGLGGPQVGLGGPQDMPQITPIYPNCNLPVMGQPPTFHPTGCPSSPPSRGALPQENHRHHGLHPHDAGRFHINLRAGPGGDVVLHLNPRMDEGGAVVRNAFLGGCWGEEERDISCCHPFQRGRYFDLSIRCGNHRFKVFAEGQPLLEFRHRVPCGPHVDVLEIEGDVVLSYVHF